MDRNSNGGCQQRPESCLRGTRSLGHSGEAWRSAKRSRRGGRLVVLSRSKLCLWTNARGRWRYDNRWVYALVMDWRARSNELPDASADAGSSITILRSPVSLNRSYADFPPLG